MGSIICRHNHPTARTRLRRRIQAANAKFLHYRPHIVLLTNIHFDHPDFYHTEAQIIDIYRRLRDIVPSEGLMVYNFDDIRCRALCESASCELAGFGFSKGAKYRITDVKAGPDRTQFRLAGQSFSIPQAGRMNVANAAAVSLGSLHWGISLSESSKALESFPGALRRQEFLRSDSRLVLVSDTAYHPNAVGQLLEAMKLRFPNRRLCLILQPRHTFGEGNWQQKLWPLALKKADRVIITDPHNPPAAKINYFSAETASSQSNGKGGSVLYVGKPERAADFYAEERMEGDVWVLCLAKWFVQPRKQIVDASCDL